jgi:hypothetical protein
MPNSGKGISVIVAGATGITGRELVSGLVMHPRVDRVVALSRSPIPVDRWPAVFPKLRIQDALKHLSVVRVDWDKLLRDSSQIPFTYLSRGEQPQQQEGGLSDNGADSELLGFGRSGGFNAGGGGQGSMDNFFSSTREDFDPNEAASLWKGDGDETGSGTGPTLSERQRFQFTRELLESPFYRSVFSGHHVAINCLGSHHPLFASEVTKVDMMYAVAFAKLVRAFSCRVGQAEDWVTRPHGNVALQVAYGSEIWAEVQAACYGSRRGGWDGEAAAVSSSSPDHPATAASSSVPRGDVTAAPPDNLPLPVVVPTLSQFVQLSTAGASERSPIPYFAAHGEADSVLLGLFNRSAADSIRTNCHKPAPSNNASSSSGATSGGQMPSPARVFCDNSRLTIWRPGLLHRRGSSRRAERLMSLVLPAVCAEELAALILEDIVSSLDDGRGCDETGPTRVVSASSIAVWAGMRRHRRKD